MSPPSTAPYLKRLAITRCRLSYAQQRIRELEDLLLKSGIEVPNWITAVPSINHDCDRTVSEKAI